jgi:hypothetical protein
MMNKLNQYLKIIFLGLLFISVVLFTTEKASAEQVTLTLKQLGADQNVDLKTVKTFREFYFTKPENWMMAPSTKLILTFQHSPQLLPERSSLTILINDQSIESIELNKGNASTTTVSIPIPVSILKDYNKLTFDVDQHYTYKCEDPFDPSLWTTVLNTSTLQLDFTRTIPKTDFFRYPYPIYDPLEYRDTELNFVIPRPEANRDQTLKSMAMVNASIAQHVGWKPLKVMAYTPDKLNEKANLIIVGTPKENAAIRLFNDSLPYKISGDQFVDSSGSPIGDNFGILMMVPNPKDRGSAILIVSGNTPEAVLKAANALTQYPTRGILKGNTVIVKENLPPQLSEFRNWPEYVRTKKATLMDIQHETKTTRGVTSVPIKYSLNLMPDMSMPPRNFVKMNVIYSYAANLDPDMSKLEILLNNKAFHSVALDNTSGENLKNLELEIPTESVELYNTLEFRYHLFPIKFDICRFTTDEHVWGTIHNTTSFDFPATIKTVIPDMGLINDGGYPFTAYRDMQENVFVLADDFTAYDVYGMLWVAARLAKLTQPTEAVNFDVVRYSNMKGSHKNNKNIITLGTKTRNKLIKDVDPELNLIFGEDQFKILKQDKIDAISELRNEPNQGIIEQMLSPWNTNRVLMVVYGEDDKGLLNAISAFSDTNKFKNIERGNIVAVSETVQSITTLRKDQAKQLYGEQAKRKAATAEFWWNLFKIFLMVVGTLAIIRIIFGAFLRGAAGQR